MHVGCVSVYVMFGCLDTPESQRDKAAVILNVHMWAFSDCNKAPSIFGYFVLLSCLYLDGLGL